MGKKRSTTSILTKTYASSFSASSSHVNKNTLSVTDKLSKLRLEGLQQERNLHGSPRSRGPISSSSVPSQVVPEISEILGQEYVQPQSRFKPRNRGHLAPRSWHIHNNTVRGGLMVLDYNIGSDVSNHTLVDICLSHVLNNIDDYLDCGMNHLPGFLKSRILGCSYEGINDAVWRDIVPEVDDEIAAVDLSMAKPTLACLKRLIGLRTASISASQVESGLIAALPSVLQDLTIRPLEVILDSTPARKAYWRRLSSHLIALRRITLDLRALDIASQSGLDALLGLLLEGPDWREALETVRDLVFMVRTEEDAAQLASSLPYLAFKGSLRKVRRRGKHVDCHIQHSTVC